MPTLNPPGSTVAVQVSEERAPKLLAKGWTATGGTKKEPADDRTCDVCGFEAKTAGGLSVHSRKHDDEE